jgi:hypothetical protein
MKLDWLGAKYFVSWGKTAHTLQPGISGWSASRHITRFIVPPLEADPLCAQKIPELQTKSTENFSVPLCRSLP